jgi:hypothetical protein
MTTLKLRGCYFHMLRDGHQIYEIRYMNPIIASLPEKCEIYVKNGEDSDQPGVVAILEVTQVINKIPQYLQNKNNVSINTENALKNNKYAVMSLSPC